MSFVSPFFADLMLWLMYIAISVAIAVTGVSVVKTLRMRTKEDEVVNGVPQTRIAWTVTWLLGSSQPLITNGQLFTSTFWLKTTDMFIYTSVILIIGCFVGVIVNRFRN